MSKIGICRKCGRIGFTILHHIIPFKDYYKDERKIEICSNCHTDYHTYLPAKKQKKSLYETFFISWIFGSFNKYND